MAASAVERQGYYYQIFLPDDGLTGDIDAIAEAATGGNNATLPGSSNAEVIWCCYAWPVQATKTGNRAFFINQAGDVTSTPNQIGSLNVTAANRYSGIAAGTRPLPFAALIAEDMGSQPALAAGGGADSVDERIWTPVGN